MAKDLSSNGTILASGFADKCAKMRGVDFRDCLGSLFAYAEAVTSVEFEMDKLYSSLDFAMELWNTETRIQ